MKRRISEPISSHRRGFAIVVVITTLGLLFLMLFGVLGYQMDTALTGGQGLDRARLDSMENEAGAAACQEWAAQGKPAVYDGGPAAQTRQPTAADRALLEKLGWKGNVAASLMVEIRVWRETGTLSRHSTYFCPGGRWRNRILLERTYREP